MTPEELAKKLDNLVESVEDKAQKKLAQIKKQELIRAYKGDDEAVTFQSIFDEVKNQPKKPYISTGYITLDKYLGGGIRPGELILISGYTGNGKTSFCFDMTSHMREQNPYWFPFEESAEELAEKCLIWKKDPLHFYTAKKIVKDDFAWMEERVLETVIKHNTKVIFIDNLHFLTMGGEDKDKAFLKTANLAKQLKQLANKMGVAIVLIAHLRKSLGGLDKMPTFEDISGSSDIVKVSNKVLAVWRKCKRNAQGKLEYEEETQVAVQKVREANGKLDVVEFKWEKGIYTENTMAASVNQFATIPGERATTNNW